MNNLKNNALDLWNHQKPRFVFYVTRLGIGLLFALSLVMNYAKGIELVNGHVPLTIFPGGKLFFFILFVLVFVNAFLILVKKDKLNKTLFLVQAILGTIVVLYGILMYEVGIKDATTNVTHGFGYLLGLVTLALLWFIYIKEDLAYNLIKNTFFKDYEEVAEVEETNDVEELEEGLEFEKESL